MKFLIYVDPASAMLIGNERIREQYVDIDLKTLTEAEREVVSRAQILSKPDAVDLRRYSNGMRNADVDTLVLDDANASSVRKMITAIVNAEAQREEARQFAETHARTVAQYFVDHTAPAHRFFGDPPEDQLIILWLKQNHPDMNWSSDGDDEAGQGVVSDIRFKMQTSIGDPTDKPDFRSLYLWGKALDLLPDNEAGRQALKDSLATIICREEHSHWLQELLKKRRTRLVAAFKQELEEKRKTIDAIVDEARTAIRKQQEEDELVYQTICDAAKRQPSLSILERYEEDILPELEFMAILRDKAFAPLASLKRFKRIDDSDVKKRRNQTVDYSTSVSTEVKPKHYALATTIKEAMPEATVTHVIHRASVDGECMIERDSVLVATRFGGYDLSREYIPE